jgi:hypothetical protein
MAASTKERKLSRLGSCKGTTESGGGGLGSPASRGHRAAAGPQRRLFAALFGFLCAGVVVLGGVHVIGGEPFGSRWGFLPSPCRELDIWWGLGRPRKKINLTGI